MLFLTGVKSSAFGRFSGRQRPDADEVDGGGSGSDAATGGRTTSPFGDSLREFVLHSLNAKGARPAYETFPTKTSSPSER